ncbi:Serine hydroxymethyltransferase, mitochondrial [Smittium culicis]|uniref:Serine hydroxymethyltransferase n=1 Tax=Smittium culicis TaxID=133412 RepID=A0A1R1X193_9FUNG|nr:Serine hydroxymethyltransferase, mitochondrial [Smittium culicis]
MFASKSYAARASSSLLKRSVNSKAVNSANKARFYSANASVLTKSLSESDPEVFSIIENEKIRQRDSIVLIASENFTSRAVMDALGSVMQNKYSEGYPGQRYYAGNEWIDKSELLCQKRALECFNLDPEKWGVNVQPHSGSPANMQVYGALLKPHERIMGLDLPHGGHLTHGFQTPTKKISMVSAYFETMPYQCDISTGLIDYDMLEKTATLYRPKIIIAGTTAYSRLVDYKRMREICDKVGAYMLGDMSHISGLVAAGTIPSPFEYADVVSTTTHKSLRGPRGAMIFFRKGERKPATGKKPAVMYDLEGPINNSVFPGHQGGPHNHTIAALSVALKEATLPEFKAYQKQVLANSIAFGKAFSNLGYSLATGGTDNHLLLIDLMESKGIDGARAELVCELASIITNKNTVPRDKSALIPSGIRVGTPAMTTRGLLEKDFEQVAKFMDRAFDITHKLSNSQEYNTKKFSTFKAALGNDTTKIDAELDQLKKEVVDFSRAFPTAGFN